MDIELPGLFRDSPQFYWSPLFLLNSSIVKPWLTTANPLWAALSAARSMRRTCAFPLSCTVGVGPYSGGSEISSLSVAPTGGQEGVRIKAPATLTSRLIPAPCTRLPRGPSHENFTGACNP